jgi:hypothetical protein
MEHAIRHHISLHMDEDPTRYRRLSERLEQILADHQGNWEQQAFALADFLEKIKTEDSERDRGDSSALNRVESALYGLLAAETATDGIKGNHGHADHRRRLPARQLDVHGHGQRPAADRPAHRRARRHRHRGDPARDRRGEARQGDHRQAPVALREAPRTSRDRNACTAADKLNIHWAAMQLTADLIDYVLVHELAHVRHPDHGPEFWRAVEHPLPDFAARRTHLRLTGPALWLPGGI